MKKILMILTSHDQLVNTDKTTGVWIGEFTDPYYEFKDKNYTVVLASPKGGAPPIDPMSQLTENITGSNRRFKNDDFAQHALKHTLTLEEVDTNDFDALFFPGGHGPMFDLADNFTSGAIIQEFITAGKPVAAVCHGPAALIKAAQMDPNILKGKRITGFSNAEETLAMRKDHVSYLLEDKLKELGADYRKATVPFMAHVEQDGLLITGQNPLSASPTAKKLIELLESK